MESVGLGVARTRSQAAVYVPGEACPFPRYFRRRIDEAQFRNRDRRACGRVAGVDDDAAVLLGAQRADHLVAVLEIHGNRCLGRDAQDVGPPDIQIAGIGRIEYKAVALFANY
jgi:hypothetical protein